VPVWRCTATACPQMRVVGSRAELESLAGRAVADWHRPHIDEVELPCACGARMRRVPDVLDCWFESGSMPYASEHFPFDNEAAFRASFPGAFIVAYVAQKRGRLYST